MIPRPTRPPAPRSPVRDGRRRRGAVHPGPYDGPCACDVGLHDQLLGVGPVVTTGAGVPGRARPVGTADLRARRDAGAARIGVPRADRCVDRSIRRTGHVHRAQPRGRRASGVPRRVRELPCAARRRLRPRSVRRVLRDRHPVRQPLVPSRAPWVRARHLRCRHVGTAIAGFTSPPLAEAFSRRAPFLLVAVVMLVTAAVFFLFGRPVGGWLSDRFGGSRVLVVALAVVAAGAAVVAFTPGIVVATVAFLSMAAALGVGNGAVFALVGTRAPSTKVGAVTGFRRRGRWARWLLPATGDGCRVRGDRFVCDRIGVALPHRGGGHDVHVPTVRHTFGTRRVTGGPPPPQASVASGFTGRASRARPTRRRSAPAALHARSLPLAGCRAREHRRVRRAPGSRAVLPRRAAGG